MADVGALNHQHLTHKQHASHRGAFFRAYFMQNVRVPADVLATLIRVYKVCGYDNLDPEARKFYPVVHQLEFTATRKLKEGKKNET